MSYNPAISFWPITLVGLIFINNSPSELFLLPYSSALSLPIYRTAIILAHLKSSFWSALLIISAIAFTEFLPVLKIRLSSSSKVYQIGTTCGIPFLLIVPNFP